VKRKRVGLVFGGRTVEHDVSLISARAVAAHLDHDKYEVVPIGITREGFWLTAGDAQSLLGADLGHARATRAVLTGDPSVGGLVPIEKAGARVGIDVIFPLVHGQGGEDGTLQGLLELAGLPYVGSGVLGSSLGMDKVAMKTMFRSAGLPQAEYFAVSRGRIQRDLPGIQREVAELLGYPCFTKPSNGGSSVGVSKVKSPEGLRAALEEASTYDRRVVIEEAVAAQEVECAVLGNEEPEASVAGEIVPCREFYDYTAKYLEEGSELIIPARITQAQAEKVRAMSITAFKVLDCAGMARVDFFVRRSDGAVLINEINTIPGFTPISMYPRLWEASGVAFAPLVDRLIALAIERHEQNRSLKREFAPGQKAPGVR